MKSKRRSSRPIILIVIGVLLIVSAILLGTQNSAAPEVASDNPVTPNQPFPNVTRVSLQDAKAAYEIGNAVFVDVRASQWFEESHIPGALSIPIEELQERAGELDPDSWIITYCT